MATDVPPEGPPKEIPGELPEEPWETQFPRVESPFFERLLAQGAFAENHRRHAQELSENGFTVIENAFEADLVEQVKAQVAPLLASTEPDPRRHPGRFHDAWQECPAVRALATDDRILELLRDLYGREPIPFQTLNFRYGTEQSAHADTVHFNSFPRRFMCGVWVALEEVSERNGALFYYPGSHRLEGMDYDDLGLRYLNPQRADSLEALTYADHEHYEAFVEQRMAAHGLERRSLRAAPGSAVIWAANLVHGGGAIGEPGSTRWSQVTHFYFEDCVYYAPICSNALTGDLHLKRIVDLRTGEVVRHRYRGLELPAVEQDGLFKLYFDVDDQGEERLALVSNYEIKHLEDDNRHLRGVEAENANLWRMKEDLEGSLAVLQGSSSYRLARLLSAPLRALRRR